MPLVLDPPALPEPELRRLRDSLVADMAQTEEFVDRPGAAVRDPLSLETARDLIRSAKAVLDRPGERDGRGWAAEANLAYAVLLAAIDLVKSHTELPRVPKGR